VEVITQGIVNLLVVQNKELIGRMAELKTQLEAERQLGENLESRLV